MSAVRTPRWAPYAMYVGGLFHAWIFTTIMLSPNREALPPPSFPMQLSPSQLAGTDITIKMPPVAAKVLIMSQSDWTDWLDKNKLGHSVSGAQTWEGGECAVRVPVYSVMATPRLGRAAFAFNDNADTIAHELLHCAAGTWHPSWDQIEATIVSETSKAAPLITEAYVFHLGSGAEELVAIKDSGPTSFNWPVVQRCAARPLAHQPSDERTEIINCRLFLAARHEGAAAANPDWVDPIPAAPMVRDDDYEKTP